MDLEIIIYAFIAFVLIAKLWSVLGRKNDQDASSPNPYADPARKPELDEDFTVRAGLSGPAQERPLLLKSSRVAPTSLAGALEEIKEREPGFDEKQFLEGAKEAFRRIVLDFSKGDMSSSVAWIDSKVRQKFEKAIEARRSANETFETTIRKIEAETSLIRFEGTMVFITVRFVSEQENILRDESGHIIGGHQGNIEQITDQWVFSRTLGHYDPNWLLVET